MESAENRCLALSGSSDKTLKLWDLSSFELLGTLSGHKGKIYGCVVGKRGTFALSAAGDATVKCWCLSTLTCVHTFSNHRDKVSCVDVSGPKAVSGGFDGSLQVYDLYKHDKDGRRVAAFNHVGSYIGHEAGSEVYCCTMFRGGTRVLSAGNDRALHVVDLTESAGSSSSTKFRCLLRLRGDHLAIYTLAVFGGDTKVVSAGRDTTLQVWHLPHHESSESVVEKSSSRGRRGRSQNLADSSSGRVRSKSRSRSSSRNSFQRSSMSRSKSSTQTMRSILSHGFTPEVPTIGGASEHTLTLSRVVDEETEDGA